MLLRYWSTSICIFVLFVAAARAESFPEQIAAAAEKQVGVTRIYDGSYVRLAYPNGDLPLERGVCTDVIIRALRELGIDLQRLVHEDMKRAWSKYPNRWGLKGPDKNIDHRRVPNLETFFRRAGFTLRVSVSALDYLTGDLVVWRLPSGVPHIGIVTEKKTDVRPLIVHNIGAGVKVEDILFEYPITGHYRLNPSALTGGKLRL